MKSTLKSNISQSGSSFSLVMSGRVDEYSNFPTLEATKSIFTFDLSGVTFINSVGIANWTRWIGALARNNPEMQIEFRRVTPQLVKPMNEIQGFLPPRFSVESFFVPYFCEACLKNYDFEYRRGFNFDSGDITKIINSMATCPKCECAIEPDVIPSRYFHFLRFAIFSK